MATIKKKMEWSKRQSPTYQEGHYKKKSLTLSRMNSTACFFCSRAGQRLTAVISTFLIFSTIFGSFWPLEATSQRVLSPRPPCRRPTCSYMLRRARTFPRKGVLEKTNTNTHTHTHTRVQVHMVHIGVSFFCFS